MLVRIALLSFLVIQLNTLGLQCQQQVRAQQIEMLDISQEDGKVVGTLIFLNQFGGCEDAIKFKTYFFDEEYEQLGDEVTEMNVKNDTEFEQFSIDFKIPFAVIDNLAGDKFAVSQDFGDYVQIKVTVQVQVLLSIQDQVLNTIAVNIVIFESKTANADSEKQPAMFRQETTCPSECCDDNLCVITNNYHIDYTFVHSNSENSRAETALDYQWMEDIHLRTIIHEDEFKQRKNTTQANQNNQSRILESVNDLLGEGHITSHANTEEHTWTESPRHLTIFNIYYRSTNDQLSAVDGRDISVVRYNITDENEDVVGEQAVFTWVHRANANDPGTYILNTKICADMADGKCYLVNNDNQILMNQTVEIHKRNRRRFLQSTTPEYNANANKYAMNQFIAPVTLKLGLKDVILNKNNPNRWIQLWGGTGLLIVCIIGCICYQCGYCGSKEHKKEESGDLHGDIPTEHPQTGDKIQKVHRTIGPLPGNGSHRDSPYKKVPIEQDLQLKGRKKTKSTMLLSSALEDKDLDPNPERESRNILSNPRESDHDLNNDNKI